MRLFSVVVLFFCGTYLLLVFLSLSLLRGCFYVCSFYFLSMRLFCVSLELLKLQQEPYDSSLRSGIQLADVSPADLCVKVQTLNSECSSLHQPLHFLSAASY